MYKEVKGRGHRNKFWSKKTVLEDLRHVGNLKGVCEIYADEKTGWRGYYNSLRQWRKEDAAFDKEVGIILSESDTSLQPGPGRERKDGGDLSWQDDYCRALYEFDGNRKLASAVTPYSFGQIMDFLNPETTSFDKAFAEKVKIAEAEISAEIEAMVLGLRKPENFETFEQSKISQTKAWYGLKILEKLDRMRYGRYVEMNMKADVKHQHTVQLLPPEQKLFNLWEEQRKHLEARRQALIEGVNPDQKLDEGPEKEPEEVIEGEVVE